MTNEVLHYTLPVGAHLMVEEGEEIQAGKILVKIARKRRKQVILPVVFHV